MRLNKLFGLFFLSVLTIQLSGVVSANALFSLGSGAGTALRASDITMHTHCKGAERWLVRLSDGDSGETVVIATEEGTGEGSDEETSDEAEDSDEGEDAFDGGSSGGGKRDGDSDIKFIKKEARRLTLETILNAFNSMMLAKLVSVADVLSIFNSIYFVVNEQKIDLQELIQAIRSRFNFYNIGILLRRLTLLLRSVSVHLDGRVRYYWEELIKANSIEFFATVPFPDEMWSAFLQSYDFGGDVFASMLKDLHSRVFPDAVVREGKGKEEE